MRNLLLSLLFLSPFGAIAQTDSLGVYAVTDNGLVKIEPIRNLKTTTVRKRGCFISYTEFKGETSKYVVPKVAKFRIYLRKESNFGIENFGVCLFKPRKGLRYLVTKVISSRVVRFCTNYAETFKVETKKISDYVYEQTYEGPKGEYGLAVFMDNVAGLLDVYDFTISGGSKYKSPTYSARIMKDRIIW